jgi:hypothetical protein
VDLEPARSGNYTVLVSDAGSNEMGDVEISLVCLLGGCADAVLAPTCAGGATTDCRDNCRREPNADQRDTNGDGFGNLCDPDYNGDGVVGIPDFNILRGQFGKQSADPGFDPDVDAQGDGAIGIPDFNVLHGYFGGPPGSSEAP